MSEKMLGYDVYATENYVNEKLGINKTENQYIESGRNFKRIVHIFYLNIIEFILVTKRIKLCLMTYASKFLQARR